MRVGIIGAGTMGLHHGQAWQATSASLLGFYDSDAERAQAAAERLGVRAFASQEALFAAADIIDICTPTFTHRAIAVAAAEAGKHVICEKPMALSLSDCADMIRAAEANGVRLFIAQVVRFFPEYEKAKELIDAGAIGEVGVVRLSRGGSNPGEGPRQWFVQEYRSGGVLLDLMVHDYDYARWVAGDVERVYCQRHLGPNADYALVTLRFRSGAIGHIEGCWAYPAGIFRTSFDIAGKGGLLTYDSEAAVPLRLRLKETEAAKGGVIVPSSPLAAEDNPYLREIRHFLECVERGEEFRVTARDAMAAVQIGCAARQSALERRPVKIEPLAI
jgi:predicted dehydrogenase